MNAERAEKTKDDRPIDNTLAPLNLINRIISLLFLLVGIPVLLWAGLLIITYLPLLFPSTLAADQSVASSQLREQALTLLRDTSPFTSTFAKTLWSFLAPVLSVIIIVVLLRWLLFSQHSGAVGERLGTMVRDVPSLIAVVVIITICLLPILSTEVPAALSNIALVIVGFYFGTERRPRLPEKETEETKQQTQG